MFRMVYGQTLWHKTMCLLLEMCGLFLFFIINRWPHVLAQREETNLMCGDPFFPSFKVLLVFFDHIFFSTLLVYQTEILYQGLECVLVA